jgi:hypothetical protein
VSNAPAAPRAAAFVADTLRGDEARSILGRHDVDRLEAQLQTLAGVVGDLVVEVRRLGAQAARRQTPRSRDAKDELLLLLLVSAFGDGCVQVTDVLGRAAHSTQLQQALDHAGASNGRRLGRWFERVSRDTNGAYTVMKLGSNNRGALWRLLRV